MLEAHSASDGLERRGVLLAGIGISLAMLTDLSAGSAEAANITTVEHLFPFPSCHIDQMDEGIVCRHHLLYTQKRTDGWNARCLWRALQEQQVGEWCRSCERGA